MASPKLYTEKYIYFDADLRLPIFYPDLDLVKKICVHTYIYIFLTKSRSGIKSEESETHLKVNVF